MAIQISNGNSVIGKTRSGLTMGLSIMLLIGCSDGDLSQAELQAGAVTASFDSPSEEYQRPNILLIIADDLAYSDLGSFGGEIETPNLDGLASSGIQLTNFHTGPTCSPTRSMLLTGVDSHQVGLGNMAETMARLPFDRSQHPGHEGHLNHRTATLAELLQDAGYNTYLSGKWHLGMTEDLAPFNRGFDRTFALLNGGASHYGTDPMLEADGGAPTYTRDGQYVYPTDDFYSTRDFTNSLLDFISTDLESGKPFFAYLSYTAPHWPLQAPADVIEKYRGSYDAGYDQLQVDRLAALRNLGIVGDSAQLAEPHPAGLPWHDLSEEEQRTASRTMEIYAAMVDEMDRYIGLLLAELDEMGVLDNTLIFFMSDNGAEGASTQIYSFLTEWVPENFDLGFENMGKPGSYVMLGPDWARATVAHSRLVKGFPSQGGILAPALLWHPDLANASRVEQFVSVLDIMPTFLEVADYEHPGTSFRGQENLAPQGVSFLSLLEAPQESFREQPVSMGWELMGRQAYREGDWKILKVPPPVGTGEWELFDLSSDPSEMEDLSDDHPQRLQQLLDDWQSYVEQNGVIADWSAVLEQHTNQD